MIEVDGRTDSAKLHELLMFPEQTHLDYKEVLDLDRTSDQVEFVKDAISMANRPPGGYIIVGVCDDGSWPAHKAKIADPSMFDGARLSDKIHKYIEGEVHPVSQMHDVDGHDVVLIYIPPSRDGLPIPMSKTGQYPDSSGKNRLAFREGDILVREGAKNTPLRHVHWTDLLASRDRRIRAGAREDVDALVQALAHALRASPGTGVAIPMDVQMSEDSFQEVVISHLEAGNDVRLRQFLGQARATLTTSEHWTETLDKVTSLACLALHFQRPEVVDMAVDALYETYVTIPSREPTAQLDIINRVYVIGAAAVRARAWSSIHGLVLRPFPPAQDAYMYSSWIRQGQVDASRANIFPKDEGGLMIAAARALAAQHPSMRPDIPEIAVRVGDELDSRDPLINSLCQFDLLFVLIVQAERKHHSQGYPICSMFHGYRVDPIFELVASDARARQDLFPTSDDATIAAAVLAVHQAASRESWNYGGYWSDLPAAADKYVHAHAPTESG